MSITAGHTEPIVHYHAWTLGRYVILLLLKCSSHTNKRRARSAILPVQSTSKWRRIIAELFSNYRAT